MADQIFVTFQWDESEGIPAEAFGPWTVREDGSHLSEIDEFLKRWHATERRSGASATLWRATPPEQYEERVKAGTTEGGGDG